MRGGGRGESSLVLGTRGSRLAIWQAEWIQSRILEVASQVSVTLQRIKTSGDKTLDVPLAKIGGKGLFVKEIEEALLREDIDLAVHSLKDVPTVLPKGLAILGVPPREDPRDVLISPKHRTFDNLPKGATIGTSSLRRQAQLLHHRPDLHIVMLRGNVETRLRKVQEGEYDAVVLAAAGMRRMGLDNHVTEYLSPDFSLPAIGQGALGLEGRSQDEFIRKLVAKLNDAPTRTVVSAERSFLDRLEGGCQVPIAAHGVLQGETLVLDGMVASVDGKQLIRETLTGPSSEAQALGTRLAERILDRGGRDILNVVYGRL